MGFPDLTEMRDVRAPCSIRTRVGFFVVGHMSITFET